MLLSYLIKKNQAKIPDQTHTFIILLFLLLLLLLLDILLHINQYFSLPILQLNMELLNGTMQFKCRLFGFFLGEYEYIWSTRNTLVAFGSKEPSRSEWLFSIGKTWPPSGEDMRFSSNGGDNLCR